MNIKEIFKNYSHSISNQEELKTISLLEKDLYNIDPNYTDNLFDSLIKKENCFMDFKDKIKNLSTPHTEINEENCGMVNLNSENFKNFFKVF